MRQETLWIETPYITLQQALQLVGEISTGGMAKIYLSEHAVEVNGELESRRGRKLYPGDQVSFPSGKSCLINVR
ncbi:RNA-binding S4 domain-containing protein [Bacillaceae bacterium SIJ1]|uniref:RNA-binding S4 domain-containing protein n=1 Tax=Litoribacterium kuwaitense TaxID=1398745 RepID=UPI0013EC803B|nr:RNA-binding S4 domain-containing protein [Litoribacterium kuwaitense]NGP45194.1 RNA-binding S4 domain-containing protein [Litoribacterium kuwaitense]